METVRSTPSTPPAPERVPMTTFRARVAHYVNLVCYRGVTVLLMRKGKAVAKLEPLAEDVDEKILATNPGKIPGEL